MNRGVIEENVFVKNRQDRKGHSYYQGFLRTSDIWAGTLCPRVLSEFVSRLHAFVEGCQFGNFITNLHMLRV